MTSPADRMNPPPRDSSSQQRAARLPLQEGDDHEVRESQTMSLAEFADRRVEGELSGILSQLNGGTFMECHKADRRRDGDLDRGPGAGVPEARRCARDATASKLRAEPRRKGAEAQAAPHRCGAGTRLNRPFRRRGRWTPSSTCSLARSTRRAKHHRRGRTIVSDAPDLASRPGPGTNACLDPLLLAFFQGSGDPGVTLTSSRSAGWTRGRVPRAPDPHRRPGRRRAARDRHLRTNHPAADLSLDAGLTATRDGEVVSVEADAAAPDAVRARTGARPLGRATLQFVLGGGPVGGPDASPRGVAADLRRAWTSLDRVQPDFAEVMRRTTRRVVVFDDVGLNSLARRAAARSSSTSRTGPGRSTTSRTCCTSAATWPSRR